MNAAFATGLADAFDTARGTLFLVLLIALLVAGAIVLVVNLSSRAAPAPPPVVAPAPVFEPVPDPVQPAASKPKQPAKRAPQRRPK